MSTTARGSISKQEQNAEDVRIDTTKYKTLRNPRDQEQKRKGEERTRRGRRRLGVSSHGLLRGTHGKRGVAEQHHRQRTRRGLVPAPASSPPGTETRGAEPKRPGALHLLRAHATRTREPASRLATRKVALPPSGRQVWGTQD